MVLNKGRLFSPERKQFILAYASIGFIMFKAQVEEEDMEENIIINFGVNFGLNNPPLSRGHQDSQQMGACFKSLGYRDYDIRVIPEEATPNHLRHVFGNHFKPELQVGLSFFYFAGYASLLFDEQGNLIPNIALITQDIKAWENISNALTVEDIFQSYLSVYAHSTCFIFDLCLLDLWGPDEPEETKMFRLEQASEILISLERKYLLRPHSILVALSKNPGIRENTKGGVYTQSLISTFQAMKQGNLPICPITAHQKARYTFLQNQQMEGRILNESIYCAARGYLNFTGTNTDTARTNLKREKAREESLSEEDMLLEELDDFDIHTETVKYEFEGRKFRDDADLIRSGLQDKNNWKVRLAATKILGDGKIEPAVPVLIQMLKETNYMVKRSVAESLGKIGTEEAYEALKKIARPWPLGDPDEMTTKIAQKAVRHIEGKRAEQSGSFGNLKSRNS